MENSLAGGGGGVGGGSTDYPVLCLSCFGEWFWGIWTVGDAIPAEVLVALLGKGWWVESRDK